MHSSLPQQLSNFAFSRIAAAHARVRVDGAARHPPLAVVIVICPQLEETVRAHRRGRADGPDRERARARAIRRATGRARASARSSAWPPTRRSCSTPGRSRRIRARPAVRGRRVVVGRRGPDARFVLAGGRPDQIEAAHASRRAPRAWPDVIVFAGQRPAEEIPGVPRRRRRARLAAQHRHQHAAEDLSIPALGPADRRHAAAHAHAGARRRRGVPDAGDAAKGLPPGFSTRSPIRRGRARRRARARSSPRRSTATRRT